MTSSNWSEFTVNSSVFYTLLRSDIMSLPLHQQICLPEDDLEPELLEFLLRKAEKSDSLKGSSQTEREVKNKMLELLNVKARDLDITDKSVFPPGAESNLDDSSREKMEVSPGGLK